MALDPSGNPVQAWYNLNSGQTDLDFARYTGSGSKLSEADWTTLQEVTKGNRPRLAGGPGGLYLLSEDYESPTATSATVVDVRKYNAAPSAHRCTCSTTNTPNCSTAAPSPSLPAGTWPSSGRSSESKSLKCAC